MLTHEHIVEGFLLRAVGYQRPRDGDGVPFPWTASQTAAAELKAVAWESERDAAVKQQSAPSSKDVAKFNAGAGKWERT